MNNQIQHQIDTKKNKIMNDKFVHYPWNYKYKKEKEIHTSIVHNAYQIKEKKFPGEEK